MDPSKPEPLIVIDCSDHRVRLCGWIALLLLALTSPQWLGWAFNLFFGTILGLK